MKPFDEAKLAKVHQYILNCQLEEGRSPTIREICAACDIASTSWASKLISVLEERSCIEVTTVGNRKRITIPRNLRMGAANKASIVGECPCGEPILAQENIEATVALPVEIFGNEEHFILKAKGRSMVNRGILDGDLMVVRVQSTADVGEVVIARVNQEEATAKVLARSRGKYYLKPANDETDVDGNPLYQDIYPTGEWEIIGVVDYVIHAMKKG